MDLNNNVLYHDELGLGPDFVDLEKRFSIGTLAKESIKKKMRFETLSEEMRILYVACTRAKEKLIITGALSDIEKSIEKWSASAYLDRNTILPSEVLKGKSYLDWIGMALCKHNDGKVLRDVIKISEEISKEDRSKWKINLWNKSELSRLDDVEDINEMEEYQSAIISNSIYNNSKNKDIEKEIDKILGYKYPLKESTILKSNISVSDLKRKNEEINVEVTELYKVKEIITPKFLQEEKGLSPSERGTAVHFVMKKIDLGRTSSVDEIKDQIKELFDNEFLLEEEVKSINPNKIFNFFRSELGKMMIDSYNIGEKIYREIPFYTEISSLEIDNKLDKKYKDEKVRLQGIIDCFFESNGDLILLDYKTDYIKIGNEEDIIEKYKKQLDYYSDAIFKMTGKRVKYKYLYSFSIEKEIIVE